jgi:hypothetical protein
MEKFSTQVEALEKLASDKSALSDIGSRLVREVARAVAAEKRGEEIAHPDTEIQIRKGMDVPAQLRDHVKTDAEGRALDDVLVQSQNLIIWLRIWFRFWLRIIWGDIFRTSPLNDFRDFHDRLSFSTDEMKLLDRLGKLAG